MGTRRAGLFAAALLSACAGSSSFVPLGSIEHVLPSQYPGEDAVLLDSRVDQTVELKAVRFHKYERIAVLGQAGLREAHVSVPLRHNERLVFLRARAVGPRGDVHELSPSQIVRGKLKQPDGSVVDGAHADVPGVEVGSVIEVESDREIPGRILLTQELSLAGRLPIVRETVTLSVQLPTISEVRTYNTSALITKDQIGDMWTARVTLHDVPAQSGEAFAPPARLSVPRMAFRLVAANGSKQRSAWGDALAPALRSLYPAVPAHLPDESALAHAAVAPTERRAFLDKAVAWLATSTDLSSVVYDVAHVRPLDTVLTSHVASSTEKAVLLKAQLDRAHVDARFAVVGDAPGAIDPGFPQAWHFGHVVVSVLAQPGIDAPVLLDPSCEACAVGELPAWTARNAVLPVDAIAFWPDGDDAKVETMKTTATRVPPSTMTHRWNVALDEHGGGAITYVTEKSDEYSAKEAVQLRNPASAHAMSMASLQTRHGVTVDAADDATYDKAANVLKTQARGRGFVATQGADGLVFPLALLRETSFAKHAHARPRRTTVFFRNDYTWLEELVLTAPAGWRVKSVPGPRRHEAAGYVVEMETENRGDGAVVRIKTSTTAHEFPPEAFADVQAAIDDRDDFLRESIVLTRN